MTRKRSARWIYQVTTAMSLALLTAACATDPIGTGGGPDLDNQVERADMLMRYCDKLARAGDLRVAASICQRAYETNPSNPAPLYSLAEIYKDLGATEQAGNVYRSVLMMNPDNFDALYGLAKTSIDLGKYAEAEAQLERALQVNDQDPRVYNALAVVKDQKGEHEVAQALYRTGLLIDPGNVPLRNNLGLSLALSGEQMESIEVLRSVANEPGAGRVSSQNLALASTVKMPRKPTTEGDGPIEIRTTEPEDMAEAPEAMSDGDTMASAKSKPLHKTAGKPAVALNGKKGEKAGRPVALGSADGMLPDGSRKGSAQDVAAGIPTEFLASNDHAFQGDKAPGSKKSGKKAGKPAKSQTAKAKDAKKAPAKSKKVASKPSKGKPSKGKKNREYRVQLGAYQSEARADQAWKALMNKSKDLLGDLSPSVVQAETGTELGTVYRLRTEPLEDRAASDNLCSQLKSRSVGCFVVELAKGGTAVKAAAKAKPKVEKKPLTIEPTKTPMIQGRATPGSGPAPLLPNPAKGAATDAATGATGPGKASGIQG